MSRIAVVFPNEGSQYVGMGKEFYAKSLGVRKYYDTAEKSLGLKLAKICFLGPKEEQDALPNAHLITFLNDIAFLDPLAANRRKPELLTGVGVGEIAALVSGEAVPFGCALQFVFKRSELLRAFAEKNGGVSLGLSGIRAEQLLPLLDKPEGLLRVTQTLSPENFVVWGPAGSVDSLEKDFKDSRQVKTNRQSPRGPIFSEAAAVLEGPLSNLLTECLGEQKLRAPKIPFHRSCDGEQVGTPEGVRELLITQYSKPVQWVQTVRAVITRGFRTWVEVGPGRFYSSMVKKIDVDTRNSNVEDMKSLSTTVKVTG